jgi:predicted nucleic acid-binding protein
VEVSFYLDASVVIALLTDDAFHARADRFASGDPGPVIISDLATAEFASALGRQVRTGDLAVEEARSGLSALDIWTRRAANQTETTAADIAVATTFLRRLDLPLKTPDAIHIAIAQRLGATLVTFDRQMAASARALGTPVETP